MKSLAIDTEGRGTITRFSLCDGSQSLTAQWDQSAQRLIEKIAPSYRWIVGHNIIDYDLELLEKQGVVFPRQQIADTMVAHQCLLPHHRAAIGWAAPLYLPLEPWKHLGQSQTDVYALKDAVNDLFMWERQYEMLMERHLEYLFFEVEQPFRFLLNRLRRTGFATDGPTGRPFTVRPRYALKGVGKGHYSVVTGEVEARNPPIDPLWGGKRRRGSVPVHAAPGQRLFTCRLHDPILPLITHFTGQRLEVGSLEPSIARAIARGRGPRQFQKDLGLQLGDKKAKEMIAEFRDVNPGWVNWASRLASQLYGEGFVTNPFGRQAALGSFSDALAFLFDSTEMDLLKEYSTLVSDAVVAIEGRALILAGEEASELWARSFGSYSNIEGLEVEISEYSSNEIPGGE